MNAEPAATVKFDPAPADWHALLAQVPKPSESSRVFRSELGFPTDKPIILSGHQPVFWHPGILAKYFSTIEFAAAAKGFGAWLIVDHDEVNPSAIAYPASVSANGLQIERRTFELVPGRTWDSPAAACPTIRPVSANELPIGSVDSVSKGLRDIVGALVEQLGAANVAVQVSQANTELLRHFIDPLPHIFSTHLSRTRLWAELVVRIARDPIEAVRRYNDAISQVGETGASQLQSPSDRARTELPLWKIVKAPSGGIKRVTARSEDLQSHPPTQFWPKALLMTGLLRLAGCDVFIHGTGGTQYDRAAEIWFKTWLGERICPAVMATADVYLPLSLPNVDHADLARAQWFAHAARHNPCLVGDCDASSRKKELVRQIEMTSRRDPKRSDLFRSVHELLEVHVQKHLESIRRLDTKVERVHAALKSMSAARDRTWTWPLYDSHQIRDLQRTIADSFESCRDHDACSCT